MAVLGENASMERMRGLFGVRTHWALAVIAVSDPAWCTRRVHWSISPPVLQSALTDHRGDRWNVPERAQIK